MTPAFVPNPHFEEEAAADDGVREGLVQVAGDVANTADANVRAISGPWMPRPGRSVVEVEDDGEDVWVVVTDYAAHLYEYGSAKSPVHAPLRRAAMSHGLDLEEPIGP